MKTCRMLGSYSQTGFVQLLHLQAVGEKFSRKWLRRLVLFRSRRLVAGNCYGRINIEYRLPLATTSGELIQQVGSKRTNDIKVSQGLKEINCSMSFRNICLALNLYSGTAFLIINAGFMCHFRAQYFFPCTPITLSRKPSLRLTMHHFMKTWRCNPMYSYLRY